MLGRRLARFEHGDCHVRALEDIGELPIRASEHFTYLRVHGVN